MSVIGLNEKFEELKKKFLENKNDEVIRECKNILKKNKIDVFYNLLCLAYNNLGDSNKAIEVMNEALALNPNHPDFLNNMGTCFYMLHKWKEKVICPCPIYHPHHAHLNIETFFL